jgi:diguanylate cyclase (GGDEF)-like protein/PAS domain S-box-containing protein
MIEHHIDLLSGLRTALDNLPSYVYIKDSKSRYVYANKHTLDLFGCTSKELHLAEDSNFFPPDVMKKLRKVDLKVLLGGSTEEEIIVDDGESEKKVYLEVKTPIYSNNDNDLIVGILGISTDITYQKSLEEKALKLAITDVLTGLANRLELDSVLGGEVERLKRSQHPLSIIMFDIDHFKKVNDNHGHLIGDKCLVKVAKILKNHTRMIDTVGRWGGEEFLIICPETDLNGSRKLAEKLRTLIKESVFPEVKHITGSFGVTSFIADDTLEVFINRADQALYNAKKFGKNRVEVIE